ncbi:MAG: transglutaminase-like cysteine peptidase [Rhizobiaceae bacterium]|nr:transglutaminase-like cysteine peptidase [Rhizobiaceae bacterium]
MSKGMLRKMYSRRCFGTLVAVTIGLGMSTALAAATSPMETGKLTSQPIGHYKFCQTNPGECSVKTRDPRPEKYSNALWRNIISVNTTVNKAIRPMTDEELYGVEEYWTYPTKGAGDCEEYVLAKQLELRNLGLAMSNLLITVLRRPDGEGHAVLTVRTDNGDFILDNLNEKVVEWHQTDYTYLKVQSDRNSGRWVSITNADVPATAALP